MELIYIFLAGMAFAVVRLIVQTYRLNRDTPTKRFYEKFNEDLKTQRYVRKHGKKSLPESI